MTGKREVRFLPMEVRAGEPGERGPDGRRALREHGIDCLQRDRLRLLPESCEEYRRLCGEAL